jgi:hypothetical protein
MQPGELCKAIEYYLACQCITFKQAPGPTQPPTQWVPGTPSHSVRVAGA